MTLSLPIADSPPYDAPTPVTISSESRMPVTFESVPLDERRWDAWRAKGRVADAAFAETMRSVALMGIVVAGAVGTLWIGFD
jgi:hypothetical protein